MAKIKTQETTGLGVDLEEMEACALLVGMQMDAATVENSQRFLRKLKIQLPDDPVIPLLGIFPKNMKTLT